MGVVTVTLTGDEARMLRALDRVIGKERELARAAAATGDAARGASAKAGKGLKDQSRAAGKVESDLKRMALSYVSVGAAVSAVTSLVNGMVDAWNRSSRAAEEARASAARFQALGAGTPEERRRLLGISGVLGKDPNNVFGLGFTAKSAGLSDQNIKRLFGELQAAQRLGEDPGILGQSLIPLASSSGRDVRQLSSFTRAAARTSPLDQSAFAQSFATLGVAGDSSEQQAAVAALLSQFVTAQGGAEGGGKERGTTALRGFLNRSLANPKIRELFGQLGVGDDATALEQVLGLRGGLKSGKVSQQRIAELFGTRVGPTLRNVLAAPGLDSATGEAARFQGILDRPGNLPSLLTQEAQAFAAKDPESAALFAREQVQAQGKVRETLRGFGQSDTDLKIARARERFRRRGGGFAPVGFVREEFEQAGSAFGETPLGAALFAPFRDKGPSGPKGPGFSEETGASGLEAFGVGGAAAFGGSAVGLSFALPSIAKAVAQAKSQSGPVTSGSVSGILAPGVFNILTEIQKGGLLGPDNPLNRRATGADAEKELLRVRGLSGRDRNIAATTGPRATGDQFFESVGVPPMLTGPDAAFFDFLDTAAAKGREHQNNAFINSIRELKAPTRSSPGDPGDS